jgi:hypothetical protein
MIDRVLTCLHTMQLVKIVERDSKENGTVDMLDLVMRTALEGIGRGGLGHSFQALEEGDGNTPFRLALRNLMSDFSTTIFFVLTD